MMTTPRWWKSCCYSISVSLFYYDVESVLRLFWDCCLNCYLSNFYAFMYTLSSYDSMCNEMISLKLICWSQDQFYVLLSLQSVVLLMALSLFFAGHCPTRLLVVGGSWLSDHAMRMKSNTGLTRPDCVHTSIKQDHFFFDRDLAVAGQGQAHGTSHPHQTSPDSLWPALLQCHRSSPKFQRLFLCFSSVPAKCAVACKQTRKGSATGGVKDRRTADDKETKRKTVRNLHPHPTALLFALEAAILFSLSRIAE